MRKPWLYPLATAVLILPAVLIAGAVYRAPGTVGNVLWRMELGSYDGRLATRVSRFPDQIVIVAVDDESLQQLGAWPWKRSLHARLIDRLTADGARLIGMDVVFAEPSGSRVVVDPATGDTTVEPYVSSEDRALAAAITRSGRVTLASELVGDVTARGARAAATVVSATVPADLFAAGMAATGLTNIQRDADSIVRRAWMTRSHQDQQWPTLALSLAAQALKRDPLQLAREALAAGDATHPFLEGNTILINYCGPAGTIRRVPFYQVLEGLTPPGLFRDKIVLVGASAEILQDIYPTPMARHEPGEAGLVHMAPMPGVEVQASILATLLQGRYLRPVELSSLTVAMALAALLTVAATLYLRPLRGFLVLLAVLLAAVVLTTAALWRAGLWVPVVPLILASLLAYLEGTVYMYLTEERARLRIRRAWGNRVSAEVLQAILSNPYPRVVGRKIIGTVMFTDLRGFTTMCHAYPPEVVVSRLNEYLGAMTEVIREYGGTIHKFIGDGIMAVFGDAREDETDHAERAARACLAMQARMAALAEAARRAGNEPLRMGIGVHTGELIVGDIGSEKLLEYTVIGDTVSTASRIEGLNKDYGTGTLLSGQTRAALGEADLPMRQVGTQAVRGREEALELYTLDPPAAAPQP